MSTTTPRQALLEFTTSLEHHLADLEQAIGALRARKLPTYPPVDDEQAWADQHDASLVGLPSLLAAMRMPGELPAALPAPSARNVRRAARSGVPISDVVRGYRLAHEAVQDQLLAHAERVGTAPEVVREASRNLFAYYDWAIDRVEREYVDELQNARSSSMRLWHARIKRGLDGDENDGLDHPLEARHVAVAIDHRRGEALVGAVAEELDLEVLWCVTPEGALWAWFSGDLPDAAAVVGALERRRDDQRLHVGVGDLEQGRRGFASSHRKATIALQLGLMRDSGVSVYRDVALEGLAFGGTAVVHDFVRTELGGLAEENGRVEGLRRTLQAYFANGGSAAATARALGIAERTVTYRLRRAEEMIGGSLSERRAELEAALRLYDVLGA